jgi:hypothetical protein
VLAGSKMEESCRFGALGAMILGKKLPFAWAWRNHSGNRNIFLACPSADPTL